MTTNTI